MLKPNDVMKLPDGMHCDGDYLWLRVKGGSRSWIVRGPRKDGKKPQVGLGSAAKVSLALARKNRDALLEQWRNGVDPIEEKRKAKEAAAKRKTFAEVAEMVIENKRDGWRTSFEGRCSTLSQWQRDLATRCKPIAGKGIDEIDVASIRTIVEPLWKEGHLDAAKSLLGRLEQVFDYAIGEEWRTDANPAAWKAFKHRWPTRKAEDDHHAALPIADAPEFLRRLRASDAMAARIVEFVLLTGVRSGEARGALWSEIDFDKRTWTIPRERMKKNREHIVPLSEPAIALLTRMEGHRVGEFIFPGHELVPTFARSQWRAARQSFRKHADKPVPNASVWALVDRMTDGKATTHGFRSTFRDWCGERGVDREVAERCLAHSLGNEAEQAYARSQLVDRRRPVMEAWALFLEGRDNVVPFVRAA
jgi:integrase